MRNLFPSVRLYEKSSWKCHRAVNPGDILKNARVRAVRHSEDFTTALPRLSISITPT